MVIYIMYPIPEVYRLTLLMGVDQEVYKLMLYMKV